MTNPDDREINKRKADYTKRRQESERGSKWRQDIPEQILPLSQEALAEKAARTKANLDVYNQVIAGLLPSATYEKDDKGDNRIVILKSPGWGLMSDEMRGLISRMGAKGVSRYHYKAQSSDGQKTINLGVELPVFFRMCIKTETDPRTLPNIPEEVLRQYDLYVQTKGKSSDRSKQ